MSGAPTSDERGREVVARLAAGAALDDLGRAGGDGRLDLGGIVATGAAAGGPEQLVVLHGARLEHLDLRDAQLSGWRLHDCTIVDCNFDGADLRDWRLWGCSVTDTTAIGANLEGSAIGTGHDGAGNRWQRVGFAGADLRVVAAAGATFEDCDLSGADLSGVHLEQCTLVRCRFAGDLREVVFDQRGVEDRAPSALSEVDFAGARFVEVHLYGSPLDGVTLPADADVRLVPRFRCVVEHALTLVAGDESKPGRIVRADLDSRAAMVRGTGEDDAGVVNRRDFAAYGDDVAAFALRTFERAEADCAPPGDGRQRP